MGLGILSQFMPTGVGAMARRPSAHQIEEFVADSSGLDDQTTSSITLLHNMDTVTLTNPFANTVAHFSVKRVWQEKHMAFGATVKTESKTYTDTFDLPTDATKIITNTESKDTFLWTGAVTNNDLYITLVSVDTIDESGEKETEHVGAGQELKLFDFQKKLNQFQNKKFMKFFRGGSSYMGLGTRPRLFSLARPPVGGSGRAGGDYGGPGGASDAANIGLMGRFRAY